ncbi:hypothetical protein FNU79_12510 [Deinococcus detaillensis]|uniref:SWIM-type domain-containing protein n=1 Tax=Deinococcus detaillensis TaxID=2592048 RepID=A0A553USF6_9DEIO|nr:SWIM zinc finger family protein [Deinococcus detaillensis]TSA83146.1 hypothetical protein FNU79_12510 [Deinococcus detaillensis]
MPAAAPQLPPLNAAAVQTWSGVGEVKKGRSYVRHLDDLTAEPLETGWQLSGTAYGTETYQVSAVLCGGKVTKADCSCPVGRRGGCKHVAALLTRFSESKADFQQLRALAVVLKPLSAEQLRGVIGQLLRAAPELRFLLEQMTGPAAPITAQPLSVAALFMQLKREASRQRGDYYNDGLDTSDLDSVLDEADVLWEDQPEQALAIYLEMMEQIDAAMCGWAEPYGEPFGDALGGSLEGILSLVSEQKLPEAARHQAVDFVLKLRSLWPLAHSDELADFAAELLPAEYKTLVSRLQRVHDKSPPSGYDQGLYAKALLHLIPAAQQTPAQREALLISKGDDAQVAEYFLASASNEIQRRKLIDYFNRTKPHAPLEPLFSLFEHHAAEDILEQILTFRLNQPRMAGRLTPEHHWLLSRYAATQRREKAFELAFDGLLESAALQWERLAQSVSLDWAKDWQKALKAFEQRPNLRGLGNAQLLRLLLEGDHDLSEAEEYDRLHQGRYAEFVVLSHLPGVGIGTLTSRVREDLAQRLGEVPQYRARAAEIRLQLAAELIAKRGRDQYEQAAEQLQFLPELLGKAQAKARITDLALANKNLRSLQEELQKAKLL